MILITMKTNRRLINDGLILELILNFHAHLRSWILKEEENEQNPFVADTYKGELQYWRAL